MKRKHKILIILLAVSVTISLTTVPAFALTESEVQDQVNAVGKEVCHRKSVRMVSVRNRLFEGVTEDRQLYVLSRHQCRTHRRLYAGRGDDCYAWDRSGKKLLQVKSAAPAGVLR